MEVYAAMYTVFRTLSVLISIYSLLCFVRIALTWIPANYGRAESFLSAVCDPYMNLFRGIRWLRFGGFDFGPALGLCILNAASSLFSMLASGGRITAGLVVVIVLQIIYSIVSSFITFIVVLLGIRCALMYFQRGRYNSGSYMLNQIDNAIGPVVYRIARPFSGRRSLTYARALITTIIVLIVIRVLLGAILRFVAGLLLP